MSMFANPEEHAANPPQSWQVAKAADRCWQLTTKDGAVLHSYTTRHAAEAARVSGPYVTFYDRETRWYAGHPVPGWKPYRALLAGA